MAWRLRVLGQASLETAGRRVVPERKTAALLAYLAIEGQATRSRLAGLLWPDSAEERARGNLRQLLRRLRTGTGEDVLDAGDLVRLLPSVEVDLVELQAAAVTKELATAVWHTGDLLAGHDYDDCSELLEWLEAQRERLNVLRRELLAAQIASLSEGQDYATALRLVECLIELDPLAEEPYRKAMRLHYLAGDRAAALKAYGRCRDVLARELGVEPHSETLDLAREIERGAPSLPSRSRHLPLALERPPVLAGREREWAALELARERGLFAVVRAEPGMGKTRLAGDFASTYGPWLRMVARPGDEGIPYALFIRSWREIVTSSDLSPSAPWVRQELARLIPELAVEPLPVVSGSQWQGDKVRLLEAMREQVNSVAAAGYRTIVVDDLQYADDASLEAVSYLISHETAIANVAWLLCYRKGELGTQRESRLERAVEAGGTVIELEALGSDSVANLLAGLSMPTSLELAEPLTRYSGGNPLFIVETLKSLAESDSLHRPFPAKLAPPRELNSVIGGRLARLSPGALRLARAAAVLEEAFDLEGAGHLLGADPLELADALAELEVAGILAEGGFSHDLVREAVLEAMPGAVRRLLHERAARHLEELPVPPGLVARHYLSAGDERRAAPFLAEAGESAASAYRLEDAQLLYRQAAELYERQGELDEAFDALNVASELLLKSEYGPRHGEVERALFRLARKPAQLAVAWQTRSLFLQLLANAEESEAAAREGHRFAIAAGDTALQVDLLNNLVGALWLQDRIAETTEILAEAISLGEDMGDQVRLSESLANMGVILDHLNRHREAIEYHRRAEALRAKYGGRLGQVQVMSNLSVSQAELGLARDSLATARRMMLLLEEVQGADDLKVHARIAAGAAQRDLGNVGEALTMLQSALDLAEHLNTWISGPVRRHLALTYAFLGRPGEARVLLSTSLEQADSPRQFRAADLQVLAVVMQQLGEDGLPLVLEAEAVGGEEARPLRRGNLLLAKSQALRGEEALATALAALDLAERFDLEGLTVAARTRCAAASLALGMVEDAVAHSGAAMEKAAEYTAPDFYFGEVLFVRYRALAAAGSRESAAALTRAVDWLAQASTGIACEQDRQAFLDGNPVNREIIAAAGTLDQVPRRDLSLKRGGVVAD